MCSLLQETALSKVQQEYIDILNRSGANLMIIINDFLTISSMNAGKLEFRPRPFAFNEICEDLYNIFSIDTNAKGIELKFGPCDFKDIIFLGDPTRIYQIFQNLLSNAIKFTSHGSVQIMSKVIEDNEDQKLLRFEIKDTGRGIPLDKQQTIFESFTQAHRAEEIGYSGTGLGLNIVKHLVEFMNGKVSLVSEENVGTTFTLDLPFELAPKEDKIKPVNRKVAKVPEEWQALKFLMIEDNLANIVYARELFRRWKLDITFCETYNSGLQAAKENSYDLILCDLNLPDGYGIDLLKEIRSDYNALSQSSKMAIITASILQADRDNAASFDIEGYIEKPFVPQKLLTELHLILKSNISFDEPKIKNDIVEQREGIETALNGISKNPNVHLELLEIFLSQFRTDIDVLSKSVDKEDHSNIYSAAHKMKSSLKILDKEMYEQVSLLEKYGSEKEDISKIKSEYLSFHQKFKNKIPVLEQTKKKIENDLLLNG